MPDTHRSGGNGHQEADPVPERCTSGPNHECPSVACTSPSPSPVFEQPTVEPNSPKSIILYLFFVSWAAGTLFCGLPQRLLPLLTFHRVPWLTRPSHHNNDMVNTHHPGANGNHESAPLVSAWSTSNSSCKYPRPAPRPAPKQPTEEMKSTTHAILHAIFVVLCCWLPASMFIICTACLFSGLCLGFFAATGTIALVLGNSILRTVDAAHYTNDASAAAIGAAGGNFAVLCVNALSRFIRSLANKQGRAPVYIAWPITKLTMLLAGVFGVLILKHYRVDIGNIDLDHGARAGALGGALLGPIAFLAGPSIVRVRRKLLSWQADAIDISRDFLNRDLGECWKGRHTFRLLPIGSCEEDRDMEAHLEDVVDTDDSFDSCEGDD